MKRAIRATALAVAAVVVFGALHIRNAWPRPNRRAVRAGLGQVGVITKATLKLVGAPESVDDRRMRRLRN